MTLIRWNPVREFASWHPANELFTDVNQMQKVFDRFIDHWRGGSAGDTSLSALMPVVDVVERENSFDIQLELPGVSKEDVRITVNNGVLTVKGEKHAEEEKKGDNYYRMERAYGTFQRSFTLPTSVSSDKIEASYDNGVLHISLPKAEEAKPKEIQVKVK